jgi:hypothetical protein
MGGRITRFDDVYRLMVVKWHGFGFVSVVKMTGNGGKVW